MIIVHVGASSFPVGTASVQRIRATYKSIKQAGFTPLIINKESLRKDNNLVKRVSRFDGIPYVYTSTVLSRPDSFVVRNLNKITGKAAEIKLLIRKRKKIGAAILYNTSSFRELLYYRLLSWLLGFKLVFQYVEFRSSFKDSSPLRKFNNYLFDNYSSFFTDGIIVISEFIKEEVQKRNSNVPILKIPVICDFEEFNKIPPSSPGFVYLLYCGSTEYLPVILFIIELYETLKNKNLYKGNLMLIIGVNNEEALQAIHHKIQASPYRNNIHVKSNLPYSQLIGSYKSADLLLIPLRNSIQDIARFPHKIGEYTASRRPFVSTNEGEIKYYFSNGVSAVLAEEYTIEAYMKVLGEILADENYSAQLDAIGQKGYETGYSNFHLESSTEPLKFFLNKLTGNKYSKLMIAAA